MPDVLLAGDDGYEKATSPHNSSGSQRPAAVIKAAGVEDIVAAISEARHRGLRVLPQATGHGAGGVVGDDTLILDTSGLRSLIIDPDARTATAGAGLTWGEINPRAQEHGLLGLAGSSPTVCIAGYTFGGGIGWLSRPHGMASARLRRVTYVDGAGTVRHAADDAAEDVDREAMFAFRGGGGVGVATELEFDLVPVPDLHAGYLLWPVAHLDAVVGAWAAALPHLGEDVATSIAVLHAPPAPPFSDDLRGTTLVHLAVAASTGATGAQPMLDAVRVAATPAVNTWGRADAELLAGIHLDPPTATPALGVARWLDDAAHDAAAAILSTAVADDSPVVMLELRNVGSGSSSPPGAMSVPPSGFVVHGVAPLTGPDARPAIEAAFERVRAVAAPADIGYSVGSWVEGGTSVPDALPDAVRRRVADAADAVDPDGVLWRTRFVT